MLRLLRDIAWALVVALVVSLLVGIAQADLIRTLGSILVVVFAAAIGLTYLDRRQIASSVRGTQRAKSSSKLGPRTILPMNAIELAQSLLGQTTIQLERKVSADYKGRWVQVDSLITDLAPSDSGARLDFWQKLFDRTDRASQVGSLTVKATLRPDQSTKVGDLKRGDRVTLLGRIERFTASGGNLFLLDLSDSEVLSRATPTALPDVASAPRYQIRGRQNPERTRGLLAITNEGDHTRFAVKVLEVRGESSLLDSTPYMLGWVGGDFGFRELAHEETQLLLVARAFTQKDKDGNDVKRFALVSSAGEHIVKSDERFELHVRVLANDHSRDFQVFAVNNLGSPITISARPWEER